MSNTDTPEGTMRERSDSHYSQSDNRSQVLTQSELREKSEGSSYFAGYRFGIHGWRKRCLYVLILVLMILIIINFALTLWILKVMHFSTEGMGKLKVLNEGLRLDGEAYIMDRLVLSHMRSRRGHPLSMETYNNFTIFARKANGRVASKFSMGKNELNCVTRSFKVTDPLGKILFYADRNYVTVGANALKVSGPGGAVFEGSVQTPLVRAKSGKELRLESATRTVDITAPLGIALESRAGDISATCLSGIILKAEKGNIYLDSRNIVMPNLKKAIPHSSHKKGAYVNREPIYQLCACNSGKLFLSPPAGPCIADSRICK